MKTIFHPANERGHADHGWLDTHHSFSFANWYDPQKVHFGALRVLNDDIIGIGEGFGTHPHDNMEIVSIPLKGVLAHKDSTGSEGLIYTGDVQIMSAGTGLRHSEYNGSLTEATNFLQIWVFPKEKNIQPRYDQKSFDVAGQKNSWQILVSPDEKDNALWINQDAVFSRADLDVTTSIEYNCKFAGNRVYLFVIEGRIEVAGQTLNKRDAIGISEADHFEIKALSPANVLAIEVP
jgi:redox-sensitive bicupin YhaK (pirin superfamily)